MIPIKFVDKSVNFVKDVAAPVGLRKTLVGLWKTPVGLWKTPVGLWKTPGGLWKSLR